MDADAAGGESPERTAGVVCGLAHAGGYSVVCARRALPTLERRPDDAAGAVLSLPQRPTR